MWKKLIIMWFFSTSFCQVSYFNLMNTRECIVFFLGLPDSCGGELLRILNSVLDYTGWFKHLARVRFITSSNMDDKFSDNFHCQNQNNICNNRSTITKDPVTPQVCRNLVKCQYLKSSNWKPDDFCNNTFQECGVQQQSGHIEHFDVKTTVTLDNNRGN